MSVRTLVTLVSCMALWVCSFPSHAQGESVCLKDDHPAISFVEFQSLDLTKTPPMPLTVKAKLQLPVAFGGKAHCFQPKREVPAVVILHGSAGIDERGHFYAEALNAAGFATLEVDMWEARGVSDLSTRPPLPIVTYPDAFAALAFLSGQAYVDPARIGVLGFSWGAAISLASAEQLYAAQFGGGLRFAAHVSNYPPCYAANNTSIPALFPPAPKGAQFLNPTGAPILIQIGSEDGYDNGPDHCLALRDQIDASYGPVIEVAVYQGATHAWDRLGVPTSALDPFADEGSLFSTGVIPRVTIEPNVDLAYGSRRKVVEFFLDKL